MGNRRQRAHERMIWLLNHIDRTSCRGTVAWEDETVNAFVDAFPEALKTLRCYTLGPHSCPMLNRAAKRAEKMGYLRAGHLGNQDARSYNQRTWCRYWDLIARKVDWEDGK